MSTIYFRNSYETSDEPVNDRHPLPVAVQSPIPTDTLTPYAIQTGLSIAGTATGLTMPSGLPATAIVQVFAGAIRYWVHGGAAPTSTTGFRADINDIIELGSLEEIQRFRAIRETSVSATLEVAFWQ